MRFSATITGDKQARARFDGISGRAKNPAKACAVIQTLWQTSERHRYDTGAYGDWAPDLPSIRARKARRGQDPRTLRATGALYRSVTSPGAPGAVFRPSSDSLELGTSLAAGAEAQRGGGRRHREVVHVSTGELKAWAQAIGAYLMQDTDQ